MSDARTKQYYMHRISHEGDVARKLLEKGWLSIGYGGSGTRAFAESAKRGDADAYGRFERDLYALHNVKFRFRGWLFNFIEGMQVGDVVLVPSARSFGAYEITGDSIPKEDWPENVRAITGNRDLGYVRQVKEVAAGTKYVAKMYATDRLNKKFKFQGPGLALTDLNDLVEEALLRFDEKNPIIPGRELSDDLAAQLLQTVREKYNDAQFEELVRTYFEQLGAVAEIPSKQYKGGLAIKMGDVDVIATFESLRTIYYVQVKKHDGKSGEWAVSQVQDFADGRASMADEDGGPAYAVVLWALTLADSFSDKAPARAAEAGRLPVVLVTGPEFARMLLGVGV